MSDQPNPLGSPHLFGLADRRLDLVLTVLLITLVLASRIAAFPASIWEQDEAVFAAAILDFDATDNRPHPPWFPLWIGMGKLVHLAGFGPAMAFQLVSLFVSVWIIFPLTALWSTVMPRHLAVGSAVLFVITPGAWIFSGRAFTGTAATALLVAALAFWLQAEDRPQWLAAGSVCGALAILVRPHFLPAVVVTLLMIAHRIPVRHRRLLIAAFVVPVALGGIAFIVSAGGIAPLWSALETHAQYHFSRLDGASHGLSGSGLSRSLGHPAIAVAWLILFHFGMIHMIRQRRWNRISPILLGALTPIMVVIYGLSNPAHARYFTPVLALTCGLAFLGAATIFRHWAWPVLGVAVVLAVAAVFPSLTKYRTATSPPVAAIEEAILEAKSRNGVVVADRTLHSFFVLQRLQRLVGTPVLFDHMINLGHVPPPPPDRTIYVFDAGNGGLLERAERERRFKCSSPLLRRLSQDRFIDLRVVSGATLRGHPDAQGPLILID
jgi:hypothetical protein